MIFHELSEEDILAIIKFGHIAHKETRYGNYKFNEDSLYNLLSLIKTNPNRLFIAYSKNNNDEVISVFMGQISTEYFSGNSIASDLGMFVHPNYRGGPLFYRMYNTFENWALTNKANKIVLYHSTGIEPEKTKKLFTKLGYTEYGSIFDKELKCVEH